jgi:hypothetical protein
VDAFEYPSCDLRRGGRRDGRAAAAAGVIEVGLPVGVLQNIKEFGSEGIAIQLAAIQSKSKQRFGQRTF